MMESAYCERSAETGIIDGIEEDVGETLASRSFAGPTDLLDLAAIRLVEADETRDGQSADVGERQAAAEHGATRVAASRGEEVCGV